MEVEVEVVVDELVEVVLVDVEVEVVDVLLDVEVVVSGAIEGAS